MVRVPRDAYLVDHVLDQKQTPASLRLSALQLGLQVRYLLVGIRDRASALVGDAHEQVRVRREQLDLDRDFGIIPVAVFHGVRRRLGYGSLEPLQGSLRQSQPAHRPGYLLHRPTLVAGLAGKGKVGQDSLVSVIPRRIRSQRGLVITHANLRSLEGYQGDVVLLIPVLASEAGKLGEEKAHHRRAT